jgi:hypothetical protein
MTDDESYERISIWLNKFDNKEKIEVEHQGRKWEQLTRSEKQTTISDMLFKGFYPKQSEKLSKGVDYVRGNMDEFKETKVRNRIVIRDKLGRFFKWLR